MGEFAQYPHIYWGRSPLENVNAINKAEENKLWQGLPPVPHIGFSMSGRAMTTKQLSGNMFLIRVVTL
jgi:hypothetical protein